MVSEEDTTIVISRTGITVIIAATITADTLTDFSIQVTTLITGTMDPDLVSPFRSTSRHLLACIRLQERNFGDARWVTET